jgi:hypothetical protein
VSIVQKGVNGLCRKVDTVLPVLVDSVALAV